MRRRGITVLEVMVAMILVGAVLAGIGQLLSLVAAQQRESERRLTALHEAANQMERLAALPWSELTPETAAGLRLSSEGEDVLTQGMLAVRIVAVEPQTGSEDLVGRRVEVAVTWRNSAGRQVDPVRLVAWRFPPEEAP